MALGVAPVPRRRPRLLALELSDEEGRGARLNQAVADGLAEAKLHQAEPRPFWAHVTIARVRRGARPRPPASVGPWVEAFTARTLTLYRSNQAPAGVRYSALERMELAG